MDISPRPSPARWIIAGGLLVGTLDLLFAGGFWAMPVTTVALPAHGSASSCITSSQ
jgi:hypothetical protein